MTLRRSSRSNRPAPRRARRSSWHADWLRAVAGPPPWRDCARGSLVHRFRGAKIVPWANAVRRERPLPPAVPLPPREQPMKCAGCYCYYDGCRCWHGARVGALNFRCCGPWCVYICLVGLLNSRAQCSRRLRLCQLNCAPT